MSVSLHRENRSKQIAPAIAAAVFATVCATVVHAGPSPKAGMLVPSLSIESLPVVILAQEMPSIPDMVPRARSEQPADRPLKHEPEPGAPPSTLKLTGLAFAGGSLILAGLGTAIAMKDANSEGDADLAGAIQGVIFIELAVIAGVVGVANLSLGFGQSCASEGAISSDASNPYFIGAGISAAAGALLHGTGLALASGIEQCGNNDYRCQVGLLLPGLYFAEMGAAGLIMSVVFLGIGVVKDIASYHASAPASALPTLGIAVLPVNGGFLAGVGGRY